ncbi:MAG: DoxX family membrane protein [Candidatus Goldbacteria bacterium]|nr:DoxX family membrane protein [Candidatus Goldiibacteriota bacterium]
MNFIKKILSNNWFLGFLKVFLGFIFVVASIGKIIDPQQFAKDVYSYVLLPNAIVPLFAAIIPWIEFFAGIMLMFDIMPKSNSLIICGLLIAFIAAIAIDVYRGIEISCGCFDFLFPEEKIGMNTIIRDIILLLAGLIILFFDHNEIRLYGIIKRKK